MLPETVQGRDTGVYFPTTIEALLKQGPDFLTRAFHAVGSLPENDRVTAIARAEEFIGGGMGRKLVLDIEYERGEGLHRNLFIKFPLDPDNPLRPSFTLPLEAEVRFYLLSIGAPLPIRMPAAYFADFDPTTLSGIVISERVSYGENGVEPCLDKCQDFKLSDSLSYYRAITRAIAGLAGGDKGGALGADIGEKFPLRARLLPQGEVFPYSKADIASKLEKLRAFGAKAPRLLPKNFATDEFMKRFGREVGLVLDNHKEIYAYLNENKDFIALCHWNINLDNAWFWRDGSSELCVGLLDWGNVSQMNVARAFWGMVCAAELDFLDAHRLDLMKAFVRWYAEAGGPVISVDEFEFMYRLAVSVDALLWMIDAPSLVEANLPNFAEMTDRHDPRLQECFLARAQQHILTVMLNEWSFSNVEEAVPMLLSRLSSFR